MNGPINRCLFQIYDEKKHEKKEKKTRWAKNESKTKKKRSRKKAEKENGRENDSYKTRWKKTKQKTRWKARWKKEKVDQDKARFIRGFYCDLSCYCPTRPKTKLPSQHYENSGPYKRVFADIKISTISESIARLITLIHELKNSILPCVNP